MFEPNLEADLILMGNDGSRSQIPAYAAMLWCKCWDEEDETHWERHQVRWDATEGEIVTATKTWIGG